MRNQPAIRHTFCALLVGIFHQAWAQTDAEIGNHYYRFSNAELEAVCARMSPTTYIDGLTDGALLAVPFTGRTYFYQSACYLELARRTFDLAWCPKVRERKTMLGDGSSHSPASCQRLVASLQRNQTLIQQSADRHAAAAPSQVSSGPQKTSSGSQTSSRPNATKPLPLVSAVSPQRSPPPTARPEVE